MTNNNGIDTRIVIEHKILPDVKPVNVSQYFDKDLAIFAAPVVSEAIEKKLREKYNVQTKEVDVMREEVLGAKYDTTVQLALSKYNGHGYNLELKRFDQRELVEEYKILSKEPLVHEIGQRINYTVLQDIISNCKEFKDITPYMVYKHIYRKLRANFEYAHSGDYLVSAIYPIASYFYKMFSSFPYLSFQGEKETAKTKSARFQCQTCFNAVLSSNMNTSPLFRLVDGAGCTVILDETESLQDAERQKDLRSILNAGYQNSGSRVFRTEGDKVRRVQGYESYSPKVIANIAGTDAVIRSRCIPIITIRSIDRGIINSEIDPTDEDWQQIRDKLYMLLLLKWHELWTIKETTQNTYNISGREWELWKPLISVAKWIDKCEPKLQLRNKLVAYMPVIAERKRTRNAIDDKTTQLILCLREHFYKDDYVRTTEILTCLEISHGTSIFKGSESLGMTIGNLGFTPDSDGQKRGWHITTKQIDDLVKRYKLDK